MSHYAMSDILTITKSIKTFIWDYNNTSIIQITEFIHSSLSFLYKTDSWLDVSFAHIKYLDFCLGLMLMPLHLYFENWTYKKVTF